MRRTFARTARAAWGGFAALGIAASLVIAPASTGTAEAAAPTTAFQAGGMVIDTPNVVRRNNVVLGVPNATPEQSLPIGNGTLGVAIWSAGGFTAQLNRGDTFPDRKSPGQVTIPGLAAMTGAADYSATLDLYDGVFRAQGGGMTATAYVRSDNDQLVIDVTGAAPSVTQTATVGLWNGRASTSTASGGVAVLAETWVDNRPTTGSGQTFGTLAGITAGGRDVVATAPNSMTATVSFRPAADGSFRVVVASPGWKGGDALSAAGTALGSAATQSAASLTTTHVAWWHSYWARAGLLQMTSADGAADYMENIRTIFLYVNAAESRGAVPGSQAGVANLFAFAKDYQRWYPAAYWFWNLRMQVAANITSGTPELNLPIFDLYLDNLDEIKAWTQAEMGGLPGICVPETMRFNGNGYQNDQNVLSAASCMLRAGATWNGRTITTGAEISLWVWHQYQTTGDLDFLHKYYPLIRESTIFLLAYNPVGSDGKRHSVANAHENQWNVLDPTTNLAAMTSLFPIAVQASQLLGVDGDLRAQAQSAQSQIPALPRTDTATRKQQLDASSDAGGANMIGDSYQQSAQTHNFENIGLEPVWPYNVISDTSPLLDLAKRTYSSRPNKLKPDWSMDAIQAARLGLASEVKSAVTGATERYQAYISGLNYFEGNGQVEQMPYIEQSGVLTTALNDALAHDTDGLLRIAPAWPTGWDVSGRVFLRDSTVADIQIQSGTISTIALNVGATHVQRIRNPWPGLQVRVVDGSTGAVVVAPTSAAEISATLAAGRTYLVEQPSQPNTAFAFAAITGTPAAVAKHLGARQIGLDRPASVPATGTQPLAGQVYGLQASHSNKYADAPSGNAPVLQNQASSATSQRWKLSAAAGGSVTVSSVSSNRCLDVSGASTAPGAAVLAWTCSGSANQRWTTTAVGDGSVYRVSAVHSGLCLEVPSASTENGTALKQAACNDSPQQRWRFTAPHPSFGQDFAVRAMHSSKNMDAAVTTANPPPVVQNSPSTAPSQRWRVSDSGPGRVALTVSGTSSCLEVIGGSPTRGAQLITAPCLSGSVAQRFTLTPSAGGTAYSIRSAISGLCVDVPGANLADGTALVQWTCGTGPNQAWRFVPAA